MLTRMKRLFLLFCLSVCIGLNGATHPIALQPIDGGLVVPQVDMRVAHRKPLSTSTVVAPKVPLVDIRQTPYISPFTIRLSDGLSRIPYGRLLVSTFSNELAGTQIFRPLHTISQREGVRRVQTPFLQGKDGYFDREWNFYPTNPGVIPQTPDLADTYGGGIPYSEQVGPITGVPFVLMLLLAVGYGWVIRRRLKAER